MQKNYTYLTTKIFIIIAALFASSQAFATHNRAGEITYVQTGPLSIEMTVTTYTKSSSIAADRDSIEIFWGDGSSEFVVRSNGNGENIGNDVQVNYYKKSHTYPGRATYTIGFADPNRVSNILNVNYPNSVEVEFFLSTTFTLLDPQFQGSNSSAILLQPPLDIACANKIFMHNPNAYDPDGDSLSYELVVPRMSAQEEVPGYMYPNEISAGTDNQISINPQTGQFIWNTPKQQGEYNIAIKINEWRDGILLNSIIRDMQILVLVCENDPPVINTTEEICVIAGEKIDIPIEINDPNVDDKVGFFASGGPFNVSNPATLRNNMGFEKPAYTVSFEWQTDCNHVSDNYYQVVLRAVDNAFTDSTGLATLKTLRIKVIAPAPENLEAITEQNTIRLHWDAPYPCENTDNQFFQGFSVWRKVGSTTLSSGECEPGLPGGFYEKIVYQTKAKKDGRYTAVDMDVEKGTTYCYRVLAEFAQISTSGNPYNRIESLSSNESCQQIIRDIPLLTKVSIEESSANGRIHIRWTKPLIPDFDTTQNQSPYIYELHASTDNGISYTKIQTVVADYLSQPVDTNYHHIGVNTLTTQPYYKVIFFSNGLEYGTSSPASSTYLSLNPSDEQITLTWTENVPWSKKKFNIYAKNPAQTDYELIDSTETSTFIHKDLQNSEMYCYKIEAIGSYDINKIEDPLINWSQEVCSIPIDNVAPCAPMLTVNNLCDNEEEIIDIKELINTLQWTRPNGTCPETKDVIGYYIYFSDIEGQSVVKIDSIEDYDITKYEHIPNRGISGCYAVSAYDEDGNESELSNIACVDNCPDYELPNTFTPNKDGANDRFRPIVNRFIEYIDFQVFNKWGNKVFESNNPLINWDGTNFTGKDLPEGTYYYTCRVFEQRVSGKIEVNATLKGYINIIR